MVCPELGGCKEERRVLGESMKIGITLSVADPWSFRVAGAQENTVEARRDGGFRARALWHIVGRFYM